MKPFIFFLITCLLSLSIHAQKAYCADNFIFTKIEDGIVTQTKTKDIPISILLFPTELYVLLANNSQIYAPNIKKTIIDKQEHIYEGKTADGITSLKVRVKKINDQFSIEYSSENMILSFVTTDQ